MADIDLDKIIAKRAEARGDSGDRFTFTFAGQEWDARDPQLLSDDEKDELNDLGNNDIDVAAWFMGDEQYDRFLEAGGSSSIFFLAMRENARHLQGEIEGKPTRPNRSARRSAASKKRKQA